MCHFEKMKKIFCKVKLNIIGVFLLSLFPIFTDIQEYTTDAIAGNTQNKISCQDIQQEGTMLKEQTKSHTQQTQRVSA